MVYLNTFDIKSIKISHRVHRETFKFTKTFIALSYIYLSLLCVLCALWLSVFIGLFKPKHVLHIIEPCRFVMQP